MSLFSKIYNAKVSYLNCKKAGINSIRSFAYVFYKYINVIFKIDNTKSILEGVNIIEVMNLKPPEVLEIISLIPNLKKAKSQVQNNAKARKNIAFAESKEFKQLEIVWYVPNCSNVYGGGHYTLFKFANYFANTYNTNNIIYIYDYERNDPKISENLLNELKKALPNCKLKVQWSLDKSKKYDVIIATTWQSAYAVKNFKGPHNKFYFMQDYESLFYPAGTYFLMADYTYKFGFHGITGGNWLKEKFESFGGKAQEYIFSADKKIFHPSNHENLVRDEVSKIFFYGRPSTERRAFHLGMEAIKLISKNYPDIEIVIAGLNGLDQPKFKCTLLGNLALEKTGELYRSCDIGIALSATNLSYLPVELMASGCPVISNEGPQVEWYCKNNINSLVVAPSPIAIFEAAKSLIENKQLRQSLANEGIATTSKTTWEIEMDKIYNHILKMVNKK